MTSDLEKRLARRRLYFDGGTGTVLSSRGLPPGKPPALWSIENPREVLSLCRAYIEAGADIVKTNTFGVTPLAYPNADELITASLAIAKEARGDGDTLIAFDIGPSGRLIRPMGDLDFEDAVSAFGEAARIAEREGADLVLIETMSDLSELKAAVLGVKEASSLPIFATCAFDRSGKLMTGADAETVAATLSGLGVAALGLNCSFGPKEMLPIIAELRGATDLPIIANPNAGLPRVENRKTVYDLTPLEFAEYGRLLAEAGASILGGCCGTDPDYLAALIKATRELPLPEKRTALPTLVTSSMHAVRLGRDPILIGERLNPTGKKRLKDALRAYEADYLIGEAERQIASGARILDVNVGLPELDEASLLPKVASELQAVTDVPLCLDSSSPEALERAMRVYSGKPLVNSVTGKEESLSAVLPLIKKYGGVLIALTMDESGIPETAEERVLIAERIAERAAKFGIPKSELLIDPLALTVSADPSAPSVTLKALRLLTERGFMTSLGVSNVSFGLPKRDVINAAFFSSALSAGLCAAIMNPDSLPMQDAYHAHRALAGLDAACEEYIAYAEARADTDTASVPIKARTSDGTPLSLGEAIEAGRVKTATAAAESLSADPLSVIRDEIVPALDRVGRAFEEKRLYLPRLLLSADAAVAALSVLRERFPKKSISEHGKIVLATVKGDIHDIGKNIVRVLLESYGYEVLDLGRDVLPSRVLEAARECGASIVGLSALMTTTVPAMQETVSLIHRELPSVRVMVGGAVLTEAYAREIGADAYCADAMAAVRYAESQKV